jgi:hypothetical protein
MNGTTAPQQSRRRTQQTSTTPIYIVTVDCVAYLLSSFPSCLVEGRGTFEDGIYTAIGIGIRNLKDHSEEEKAPPHTRRPLYTIRTGYRYRSLTPSPSLLLPLPPCVRVVITRHGPFQITPPHTHTPSPLPKPNPNNPDSPNNPKPQQLPRPNKNNQIEWKWKNIFLPINLILSPFF